MILLSGDIRSCLRDVHVRKRENTGKHPVLRALTTGLEDSAIGSIDRAYFERARAQDARALLRRCDTGSPLELPPTRIAARLPGLTSAACEPFPPSHDPVRQGNPGRQPRRRDAALVPRLRDERDRRSRAARRARRAEAGAPARAVRDARAEQRLEPALQEVGAHRRRRDRQVPPARRHRGLRHHRAHGAAFLAAPHAGRRPGQLRLGRRRQRRRRCATRKSGWPRSRTRCWPTSTRRPSTSAPTTTARERAAGAAVAAAQPAGQRVGRHRGGHGDQHPAAQPERGRRRLPAPAEEPRAPASKS